MRPRVPTALRWLVAIGLVAIVLTRFDLGLVATRLAGANLLLALPAIAGLVAIHLVGAAAWRRLLAEFAGVRADWRTSIRTYYAAQAVGSITPGNLGADVYRVAIVDASATRRAAVVPIVLQRVTSTAAMIFLGAGGVAVIASSELIQRSLAGVVPWVIAVAALTVLVVAAATLRYRDEVREAWTRGREHAMHLLRDGFGLGLVFHAGSILLGWALVAAIDPGTAARSGEVLAILAVARLSVVLPVAPAGLGVQEAVVGVLFAQTGLDPQVALAAILLNRVALLVVVVIGAAVLAGGHAPRRLPAQLGNVPSPAPPR